MFLHQIFSSLLGLFGTIGFPEIMICLGVLALLFGSAKLPTLMRNMGRSINEFKAGMKDKPALPTGRNLENDSDDDRDER